MYVPPIQRDGDTIRGYALLWGDPTDAPGGAYFHRGTDWCEPLATPRPLTLWHGEPGFKSEPVGRIYKLGEDEVGRWYEAVLDRHSRWRELVKRWLDERKLASSPDGLPQYVQVTPVTLPGKKSVAVWRIDRFPVVAVSLTDTPRDHRLLNEDAPITRPLADINTIEAVKSWQRMRDMRIDDAIARYEELRRWATR